jgi:hypothetical protein
MPYECPLRGIMLLKLYRPLVKRLNILNFPEPNLIVVTAQNLVITISVYFHAVFLIVLSTCLFIFFPIVSY